MTAAAKRRRSRLFWILVGTYVLLLLASHLWRAFVPARGEPLPSQQFVEVPEFTRDGPSGGDPVRIAYQDHGPGEAPAVVMLHGSPVGSRALEPFTEALRGEGFRLVVPDLPGFGASELDVRDYSMRAHARYVLALMDELGISEAHLIGYSQGAGVVLNMADIAPHRAKTLVMLAGIGVQELELLGDYTLNHGLYFLQMLVIGAVQEGVPHFGYLDTLAFKLPYARNFWDSDQRPLRDILRAWEGPMLVVHGRGDVFVPFAAAQEHARLVPQSEKHFYEGGHLAPIFEPEKLTPEIVSFIERAEAGGALTRSEAGEERRRAAIPYKNEDLRMVSGTLFWIYMVLLVLGTQVSEDLTCVVAGLLVSRGVLDFLPATLACFAGIVIGDLGLYLIGRYAGRRALRYPPLRWMIKLEDIDRSAHWFHERGAMIILGSRFVPGSRLAVFFSAGILRVPLGKFLVYFVIAAAAWTPLLVGLSYFLGEQFLDFFEQYERFAIFGLLALIVFIFLLVHTLMPAFTWRGRRMLLGRWRRWTRWEFWPLRLFYTPVFLNILRLGITYRHWTAFTAANPSMPASGLVEEKKSLILRNLSGAGDAIARWRLLPHEASVEEQLRALKAFREEHGLGWPLVLKPDRGQRGEGVAIIRGEDEAREYLDGADDATLAQEYVEGPEFGVFYYRMPDEERGRIFGITEKKLRCVTGDGKRSLEDLILAHDETVALSPFLLRKHHDRLDWVPAAGEEVRVVDLGTHCRGAYFGDGSGLNNPQLEAWFDAVSRNDPGFFFGRYDVRAPSRETFTRAEGIRIIELNGVTSEMTGIYDRRHSVWHAWATLFRQWDLAFRIGKLNHERGVPTVSTWRLLRIWFSHRQRGKYEVEAKKR